MLSDRFDVLQTRAGKFFDLDDIDISLSADAPLGDRRQPSASEFMAYITVETATNMDLGAESKSRPKQSSRPDADQFEDLF